MELSKIKAYIGFAIKLNSDMKPYLLNLRQNYTQYTLDNILSMKSIYGVRIFELLNEKIKLRTLPRKGMDIEMSLQYIRECCDCENKYERFSQLKTRVIDRAVEEINRVTSYKVSYDYIKTGKAVTGINFHVNMKYH
jgi:plasmid replication initiation protein